MIGFYLALNYHIINVNLDVVPIYAFLRHSGKILDFHVKNLAICHLTFAEEIRHCFALSDTDCDN